MRIIALRHGQSQYNLLGLCNDDPARAVDLTGLGIEQARAAAQRLVSEPIEQIFCSPLLRARRTAEIVAEYIGLVPRVDARLADIRSGFDGRAVADYLAAISADPVDTRVNGGESLRDYRDRVAGFLQWLDSWPWQCVLLVAHEETLRILAAFYQALDLREVAGRPFRNCIPHVFHSRHATDPPSQSPLPQGEG